MARRQQAPVALDPGGDLAQRLRGAAGQGAGADQHAHRDVVAQLVVELDRQAEVLGGGGGIGVEADERLRLALGVAFQQVALARPRRRCLEDAAHQAPLEVLGLVVEDLARLAQRCQIARLEAAVDPVAQHGILAQRCDHERAQLLQEVTQGAPFPDVAFSFHGFSAVSPFPS